MTDLFKPVPADAWGPYERVADRALSPIKDRELRVAVGTLFASAQALVDDHVVDVVILAARRLVCLYELMVRVGMPPLAGCLVVSDRYLEAVTGVGSDIGAGRHVLVLDDSVVVGTTQLKLYERLCGLVEPGFGSVRSRSVCVDEDQVANFLLEGMDFVAIHHRRSSSVHDYAAEIVLTLFGHQVPFFADFPVTRPVELEEDEWARFLSSHAWHVADVTAPGLEDTGIYAVSLIPTRATVDRYLTRLSTEAAALVDAMKVRYYVSPTDTGVRVVVVPIAVLAPASPTTLDRALDQIGADLADHGNPVDLDWRGWQPEAKHRLVQLYASVCALAEVWGQMVTSRARPPLTWEMLERLPVDLYFGELSAGIRDAFDAIVECYDTTPPGRYPVPPQVRIYEPPPAPFLFDDEIQRMLWGCQEILEAVGLPEVPASSQVTKIGLVFSHAVASVFGFVNNQYELPQRNEIRALGSLKAYRDWLGDGSRRVLGQCVTLRELVHHLLPASAVDSPWTRSLVSLAVDEGNDLGVMVPVTLHDRVRDLVFRGYRLGETASLAGCPLVEAAMAESLGTDYFIAEMLAGGPVGPTMTSVADLIARRLPDPVPRTPDQLVELVRSRVPGSPVERFEGTVTAVTDDGVRASLINPAQDDPRDAVIPLARVHKDWRRKIGRGSRFTWTTFEREVPDGIRRSIEIKMRHVPVVDEAALERNAAAL